MVELYLVPYLAIVMLSMWEIVVGRIGRYSTPANPRCPGVSSVSCVRPTNIKYVSACNTQQSHRELLSTRKHPP